MEEKYLPPIKGGRWSIGRRCGEKFFMLVQNTRLDNPSEAVEVLRALGIAPTLNNLNRYFPVRGKQGRCPTLALLEIFARFGQEIKKEHGV